MTLEAFFEPDGEGGFVPSELTRGPWDAAAQHGGPPSALLAGALEAYGRDEAGERRRVTRLAIEILRPVPIEPLRLGIEPVRPGRNVELLEATLSAAGRAVISARAWRLATTELELPLPPPDPGRRKGLTLEPGSRPPAPPEQGEPRAFFDTGQDVGYHTSMDFQFLDGGFTTPGPARVWMRTPRPIVSGEPVSPLQRVMVAVDSGSGISAMLDWHRYLFINVELSVHLVREPVGEWVCLDSVTLAGDDGVGLTDTAILDERGPLGRASQALLVRERAA